jgi:hypothetical protein
MKYLTEKIFRFALLCAFLFSSFAFAKAITPTKTISLEAAAKQQLFVSENSPISTERTEYNKKKLNSHNLLPSKNKSIKGKKSSREKKSIRNIKNRDCSCGLAPRAGLQCWKDCLGRSLPPEVVSHCVNSCANGEYATCATCLGVAVAVVVSCAWECGVEEGGGGEGGGGFGQILP